MRRLRIFFATIAVLLADTLVFSGQAYHPPPSDRVRTNIDLGWKFLAGDLSGEEETHQVTDVVWESVDLPHDFCIAGPFRREHDVTQGFLPMKVGWYKKSLFLPACFDGKRIVLIFDGVYRDSDVWMNYRHLHHQTDGYSSFACDISDVVRVGNRIPNSLVVRADARRHEQDAYDGGGIYRHVWLLVTNRLHVAQWGTFVTTPEVSPDRATVEIRTKVKNEHRRAVNCELTTTIVDADGHIVETATSRQSISADGEHEFLQSADITRPNLWSPDSPYLYTAHATVKREGQVVDTDQTPFGVRSIRFDPDQGFYLNGEPLKLRGFNAHHDFAGLGTALPDRIHWNVMAALKSAGFNLYRSCHHPATPERLDACDRIGMLVWDEVERKLVSLETELDLAERTITRDRNHPSIILWSLENESPLEGTVYGTRIMREATARAHQLDPSRPTTFAASMPVNTNGYGDAVDVVSYNYHWERADQDHVANPAWKIGLVSEYSAARARRGVYGIESLDETPEAEAFNLYGGTIQSAYEMCTRVESAWRRIKARQYLGGGCIWSGVDAWGEGNAWPFVSRGDGALDACLFPKDVYYYFVSQWTAEPMVHIFPHWNWPDKRGHPIDVWCYSNCDQVELFLNGESLGSRSRPPEPMPWKPAEKPSASRSENEAEHLSWKVPYQPGSLQAVGKRGGHVVCTKTVHTAGQPARIRLSHLMSQFLDDEEVPPLVADRRDVAVLKAEILDEQGHAVPTANHVVHFAVAGTAKIMGVGNGNITSHEDNKVAARKAYNGSCIVIVQPSKQPGEFSVIAKSPNLSPDRIAIRAVAPKPVSLALISEPANRPTDVERPIAITAEIRDRFGVVIPTAQNVVTFKIDGPATFQNGRKITTAQPKGGKASTTVNLHGKSGIIRITSNADRLVPARAEIRVESKGS